MTTQPENSATEVLDNVLMNFVSSSRFIGVHKIQLFEHLKAFEPELIDGILDEVIAKLIEDKYIRHAYYNNVIVDGKNIPNVPFYTLTFDGLFFLNNGGYAGEMKRENAENIRVETLEKSQKANANRMTYLTIVIAVGTAIAAWYYLIEVGKFYHWWCP